MRAVRRPVYDSAWYLQAAALILLAGCSGNSPPSTGIPVPGVGQWVDYGGAEPAINGKSFAFPCCDGKVVAGYFYTQLPAVPKTGQTLTLNYTVIGANPIWQQASGGGQTPDINPPTLHLFLWRKGDDQTCSATTNHYRIFSNFFKPLVLGANQSMSVVLQAGNLIECEGIPTAAEITDTLSNLLGAGFTFGGQYFAGHGIYLSGGSAQFIINSLTVTP